MDFEVIKIMPNYFQIATYNHEIKAKILTRL